LINQLRANPTPFYELNAILRELVDSIKHILPDVLVGFYLQGSFAVGDFDEHSDVDFIAVISEELREQQVTKLQVMHRRIFELPSYWAQHLEGSYFPLGRLRDFTHGEDQNWYIDNGSDHLEPSNHCNSLLVRWILRERGVVLEGPPSVTLLDPIPVDALRQEMLDVMHNWGNNILTNPKKFNNRFYQSFIVLSYCRMLHDFILGYPGSKKAGAEWAKSNLDPKWQDLIDRTWSCRPKPEDTVRQPADPDDFAATIQFVQYILEESNKYRI